MRLEALKPLFINCSEKEVIGIILSNRNSRFKIMDAVAPKNKVKKAPAKKKKTKQDKLANIAAGLNPEDFLKLLDGDE
jgi:uncharacterized Fe-S radical SAM superfamily protein PflX